MILDVGCGKKPTGHVNIDVRRQLLAEWRRTGLGDFILCDAHYLPFRPRIFDEVQCIVTLPHVRNAKAVLREINRVTTDGGKLFVSHHSNLLYLKKMKFGSTRLALREMRNMAWRMFLYLFKGNYQNPVINTFQTQWGFRRLLERSGFTVLELYSQKSILNAKVVKANHLMPFMS